MKKTVLQRILEDHIVDGAFEKGAEIGIKIDQTLTQDSTGTLAYLQFEALNIPRVKTKLSVAYIDHNILQTDFRNADDHKYLQSVAQKYGVILSKAGNGICHQVHLEHFARPGWTLLGSDSHTTTAGGMGMVAIGAGGLDVAVAMAGGLYYLKVPEIFGVRLNGKLQPYVSAKDVILEVLRRLGVKGGVGKSLEYFGEGAETLTVPERSTITNMGTETGATTSVFPSDKFTRAFLDSQGRVEEWVEVEAANEDAFDDIMVINLNELEPLIAKPHSPGNVVSISEVEGISVDQVCVGSCTNSSYKDLMTVASLLKGKKIHQDVSFTISPGSRQVLEMLARNGALAELVKSGARILEAACGPCIGMGQAPSTGGVSVRTFNRNFKGRSGTSDAQIYLTSPEVAAATVLRGVISDPRELGKPPKVKLPTSFIVNKNLFVYPSKKPEMIQIIRGPNIKPVPVNKKLPSRMKGEVLIKISDNITTDHIVPAGAKILPLRSNIPAIAEHVFEQVDPTFADRAQERNGGFIIAGDNYGQGSSREHAALAPMYLGVKGVIAKSFSRIHLANLVNYGIIPLAFKNSSDYKKFSVGDLIEFDLSTLDEAPAIKNITRQLTIETLHNLSARQLGILKSGGLLNFIKARKF
jgi:aconitate hydratase